MPVNYKLVGYLTGTGLDPLIGIVSLGPCYSNLP